MARRCKRRQVVWVRDALELIWSLSRRPDAGPALAKEAV